VWKQTPTYLQVWYEPLLYIKNCLSDSDEKLSLRMARFKQLEHVPVEIMQRNVSLSVMDTNL